MFRKVNTIISYKTTETNKSFCLSLSSSTGSMTETYYADIEDYNDLDEHTSYNKNCLRDGNTIYNALYNSNELYLKSAIYNNNKYSALPNTNNFQNIFNYRLSDNNNSKNIINQIQVDNYIYQLNTRSNFGKIYLTQDIYAELSVNNGYGKIPNTRISTCLFDPSNISAAIKDDTVDISVKNNLQYISYNQFFEIPGNIKNDYDSGNYAANVYTTKNQYNSQYDMMHDDNTKLSCARNYIAIDNCNNQIYLKYYDNIYYPTTGDLSTSNTELYGHKFQKIEVLNSLNRYETLNMHKTNYYDIDIVCEKLFQSFNKAIAKKMQEDKKPIADKINLVKNNLQHEIQNCILDICKQVTPIDTQIVKVNVYESEIESNL